MLLNYLGEMPRTNPCEPSPCGPNSQCRIHDEKPACSCLPEMKGIPPNCRPECIINQDCPSTRSCISGKCIDSCKGACGSNSLCQVINHIPICSCYDGYEGDPYSACVLRQGKIFFYFLFGKFYSYFLYPHLILIVASNILYILFYV